MSTSLGDRSLHRMDNEISRERGFSYAKAGSSTAHTQLRLVRLILAAAEATNQCLE
ncbi:uncharacterized protein J3R85_003524 [Psidium guajava]|nr:uncharacterized protein J3R85_003524 [Psidium guajava]